MKKLFTSTLSIFMCAMLVFSLSVISFASEISGNGTKDDPYLIKTAEDLDELSLAVKNGENYDGKYIKVENNIEVSADFSPIGTEETAFAGNFDGNGKLLSGFNLDTDYAALFAFCDGAVISDVSINGEFFAESYAGSIVAYATDTVIENCTSSASVYADTYAGGIVGYIESGRITACTSASAAFIAGYKNYCGGIAGFSGAVISDCTNNAYTQGVDNVGGIAGAAENNIISCINNVSVSATGTNLGGIAGIAEAEIVYCKNNGRVSSHNNAGGIAGVAYSANIKECFAAGTVTATENFAGGIAAYLTNSVINNCLSTATVTATSDYAGGIFAYSLKSTVAYCVFTSTASASGSSDAAIGALSNGTVENCYYDSSKESRALYTGSAKNTSGITSADFIIETAFSALDFKNTWAINDIHADYPLLRNINYHTLEIVSSSQASCTDDGVVSGVCALCNETVEKVTPAYGHSYKIISSKTPSCTVAGYEDKICTTCSDSKSESIPATGHKDENSDKKCDVCTAEISQPSQDSEKTIFEKIADFFRGILDWFRSLFK